MRTSNIRRRAASLAVTVATPVLAVVGVVALAPTTAADWSTTATITINQDETIDMQSVVKGECEGISANTACALLNQTDLSTDDTNGLSHTATTNEADQSCTVDFTGATVETFADQSSPSGGGTITHDTAIHEFVFSTQQPTPRPHLRPLPRAPTRAAPTPPVPPTTGPPPAAPTPRSSSVASARSC